MTFLRSAIFLGMLFLSDQRLCADSLAGPGPVKTAGASKVESPVLPASIAPNSVVQAGTGRYQQSPNYTGKSVDSPILATQGTIGAPATTSSATGVFQITSSARTAQALAAMGWKISSANNARVSAVYGEAVDTVGGISSFVEGGRFQGTLVGPSINGSAYGVICAAGAEAGARNPQYVIGCEGNSIKEKGPDAPIFTGFNKNAYTAAFVATNGCAGCGSFKGDAAFVTNPYSEKPFRTGLLFGAGSIDDTGIAYRSGLSINTGIDMSQATIALYAFKSPAFSIDGSGHTVTVNVKLTPTKVGSLPTCNSGAEGTLGSVTDATSATFNAALAGGGTNHVMAYCNGTGWTVH